MAAGVVVWRQGEGGAEFLLLRNARHHTWGFAKGRLDPGERLVEGALREVLEETGIRLEGAGLREDFADTSLYQTPSGRWKRAVLFLAAAPWEGAEVRTSAEHEECGWFDAAQALERLEHPELRRTLVRAATRLAGVVGASPGPGGP